MMQNNSTKIIKLTPEYLYDKGMEYFNKAPYITLENDINIELKEIHLETITYLQAALLLGSQNAYKDLSGFYKNHLKINNPKLNNLIKIIANSDKFIYEPKSRGSTYLPEFEGANYSELENLAVPTIGYINEIKYNWGKEEFLESSIFNVLKTMIEYFNTCLHSEYQLIVNKNIYKYVEAAKILAEQQHEDKKFIDTFIDLNPKSKTEISTTQTYDYESRSMKTKSDDYDFLTPLTGNCPIS